MALGSPSIPTLRTDPKTGATDARSLQGAINAIAERLRQIEAALGATPGSTNLLSVLVGQADGFVVKSDNLLVTRTLEGSASLDIANPTGSQNPVLSAPLLDDIAGQPDGFMVKTGSDAVTRTLIGGSGSGITIHNPDGVAGDPDFTVP